MIEHVKCNTFWNYSSRDALYETCYSGGNLRSLKWSGKYAVSERVYRISLCKGITTDRMWNLLGWNNFSLSLKSVVLTPRDNDNITIPE